MTGGMPRHIVANPFGSIYVAPTPGATTGKGGTMIDWNKPLRRKGDKVAVAACRRNYFDKTHPISVMLENGEFGQYAEDGCYRLNREDAQDLENIPTEREVWVVVSVDPSPGNVAWSCVFTTLAKAHVYLESNPARRFVFGPHRITWEE